MTSVWIIYAHPATRKLLELFVASSDFCQTAEPHQERVDLILMDAARIEQIPELRSKYPESKILVITDQPEYTYPGRAREWGADGFGYIEPEAECLLELMRRVLRGETVYPDRIPPRKLGNTLTSNLTERELHVLKSLAAGQTDAEIAEKLFVSVRTVKTHIQSMREKTGFRNRTELAVRARGIGLVIPETDTV